MIVKMRKMDLLLYHREREKFLEELRGLGVVHVTSEQPVESAAAQELTAEVQRAHRIAFALKKIIKEKKLAVTPQACGDVAKLLAEYEECEAKRDRFEQELASLAKDRAALEPWGDFDPQAVKRLAEVGVGMKFYTASQKKFDALDKSNQGIKVVSTVDGVVHFAVVFRGGAPELPGAEEARLPDIGLKSLENKIAALKKDRDAAVASIEKMAAYVAAIEGYRNERYNGLKFEEARGSMACEAEGKLLKLTGWLPKESEAKVVSFLNNYPAYATFRDPLADEDVPVKLKNAGTGFSRLFEPVLGLYSLPGYREMDVAPFVAPFFTVFFGLCLGDAGYGLMVMLAAIIGMFAAGAKMRPLMALGIILGISTVASGVLLNSFFGAPMFGGETAARFSPLAGGDGNFPAMSLAFVAGFLQLFVGMGLQSYMSMRNNRSFFAGLQPISTIFMATGAVILGARTKFLGLGIEEFSVGPLEIGPTLVAIGEKFPFGPFANGSVGELLVFGGLAMLLLFNSIEKPIFIRPLTGLWALYNFLTGFLSNILSYLRLFALGLAGGLLGAAVNDIAFMFVKGADGTMNFASAGMAATVAILIGGHLLNFGLSALGSFIHPLRLTFVEFYGAVGFQGGSKPYVPFAKVEQ